jgi:hypothetical protein
MIIYLQNNKHHIEFFNLKKIIFKTYECFSLIKFKFEIIYFD